MKLNRNILTKKYATPLMATLLGLGTIAGCKSAHNIRNVPTSPAEQGKNTVDTFLVTGIFYADDLLYLRISDKNGTPALIPCPVRELSNPKVPTTTHENIIETMCTNRGDTIVIDGNHIRNLTIENAQQRFATKTR